MTVSTETIQAVRSFNRFYTSAIGALDDAHLGSELSLAEGRTLFEIGGGHAETASDIVAATRLDAGYLSRILRRFERAGLVSRVADPADRRRRALQLTPHGDALYAQMQTMADDQVAGLIHDLSEADRRRLVEALAEVRSLIGGTQAGAVMLRPLEIGDVGWIVERHGVLYAREYGWDERFEAMCARIAGDFVANFDPERERGWIAVRGSERLGSILLQKADDNVAKLRLLLVEPRARGLGVGRLLVETCVEAGRTLGYDSMELWTQSVLVAARGLYASAGFAFVESWPNRDFGGLGLTSEKWRKTY